MTRYHTPLIISACKCGGRGIAKSSWDCGENADVYIVSCTTCQSRTQWPHAYRADAVKEWNKIQGASNASN